jgi:DNA-binding transcriptional LysR family regulator
MLPSPAELHYFLEVTNTLNFSRAAERLGISQPSLSLAIQRLEKLMGTPLFVRHKKGVKLTAPGKHLLTQARELLQIWEHTKAKALESQQEVQGHIKLGCHSSMAIYLVSQFLPKLLKDFPSLHIDLKHDISRIITEEVINLSLDLGIVANPIHHNDLIIRELFNDEFGFWINKKNFNIDKKSLGKIPILCDSELNQTQTLLKECKKKQITFERIINVNNLEVIANMIENGAGIGIIPGRVAQALYPKTLHRVANMPHHPDQICLISRSENANLAAMKKVINTIKEAAANL